MKLIKLECVLMDNREILFNGRSLGWLTKEEINTYTTEVNNQSDEM